MAIPSASGTEVIKYNQCLAVSTTETLLIPSPTANHIYTVLSIIFVETANTPLDFYLRTFTNSGLSSAEHWLIRKQALHAYGTFVWNDRFSFSGNDRFLTVNTVAGANMDVHITYIDQNWA